MAVLCLIASQCLIVTNRDKPLECIKSLGYYCHNREPPFLDFMLGAGWLLCGGALCLVCLVIAICVGGVVVVMFVQKKKNMSKLFSGIG